MIRAPHGKERGELAIMREEIFEIKCESNSTSPNNNVCARKSTCGWTRLGFIVNPVMAHGPRYAPRPLPALPHIFEF